MDINNLVKQAQKMQQELEKKQKELAATEFFFESNGGAIKINMLGNKRITSIKIDEELIDPSDKEILQDLLMVAINDAINSIDEEASKILEYAGGKMNIPGLF